MRSKSPELMSEIKKYIEDYYLQNRQSPSTTKIAEAVGIARMAAYIGVSYTALVIRLRDMGLFEYHNILEYISNELNLGGVSQ